MGQQKKLLYEVSYIRPIIIFLLVILHSFTKITDGGLMHNDYQLCDGYKWFTWLISGFRIETIALIAGYVFAFQSLDLGRSYSFFAFVKKKFKRLILPMLFFGVIYYFCFYFNPATFKVGNFIISLLSGCGHLWFLPMLFWCFLVIWVIDHFHLSSWITLLLLAGVAILPTPSLPLGFTRLPHFIFYVYAGYFLWTKRDAILKHVNKKGLIASVWILYVVLVVVHHTFIVDLSLGDSIISKVINVVIYNAISLPMSCMGIIALYMTVCHFTKQESFAPKPWVITASDTCYGVYVYHQFMLVLLYFYTPIVSLLPNLLVPWVGLIVAFSISLLLTKLTLKTKFGRSLIG